MLEDKDLDLIPEVDEAEVVAEEIEEEAIEDAPVVEEVVEEVKPEPKKAEPKKKEMAAEKVAIYSARPIFWEGVGKVERGYNIVTKEQADKWVKKIHVRLATPEEIQGVLDK